ncbi:MAG: hypothetical protein ABIZ49_05535 [Opitutaceae bacterium]
MKFRLVFTILLLAPSFASAASASSDPADIVRAALKDFLDQPNYTWVVSNSRGMPEANGDDTEQATDGQHEKGGYTKVNFRSFMHIPIDERPVRKPWPGFMDREDFYSDRWVFWTPEGWKLLRDIPIPPGMGPPAAPTRSTRTPLISIPILKVPILKVGVMIRWVGFRRPDHEIAIALSYLGEVTEVRPGVFEAEIDPQGAAQLVFPPPPSRLLNILPIGVENARARITVVVRNGTLVRYELAFVGTLSVMGRRRTTTVVLIRELRDLGTTVVEVPAEVRRMFGDDAAP